MDTFKTGFGGIIAAYPDPVRRRYQHRLAWLIRQVNARFRTATGTVLRTESPPV